MLENFLLLFIELIYISYLSIGLIHGTYIEIISRGSASL
jgi:hypothetical protein